MQLDFLGNISCERMSSNYVLLLNDRLLSSKILPPNNVLPKMSDEAKKMMSSLGLDYETIHACINDCVLYQGKHEKAISCPKCGKLRFKTATNLNNGVPQKVLRHFPLAPHIEHIFRSPELAKLMDWSSKNAKGRNYENSK